MLLEDEGDEEDEWVMADSVPEEEIDTGRNWVAGGTCEEDAASDEAVPLPQPNPARQLPCYRGIGPMQPMALPVLPVCMADTKGNGASPGLRAHKEEKKKTPS